MAKGVISHKGKDYLIIFDRSVYPNRYRLKEKSKITSSDELYQKQLPGEQVVFNSSGDDPTQWEITIR